jgi:hypothetical protein
MYELEFLSLLGVVTKDVLLFEDQEEFFEVTLLSFEVYMLLPTRLCRNITKVFRRLVNLSQFRRDPAPYLLGMMMDS